MFGLFSSKTQKLVKQWSKEHKEIVNIAGKILEAYDKSNEKALKKNLKALNSLALNHLMTEDLEFYALIKQKDELDAQTTSLVNEFTNSFRRTKLVLMNFLSTYMKKDAVLDEEFIETFKVIVGVLADRIAFEEENLYAALDKIK